MTALNDLKQALSELGSTVSNLNNDIQARIDAAVAAKEAQDDAAFNEAVSDVRSMTASLTQKTEALHQTASAIAPHDIPATSAAAATGGAVVPGVAEAAAELSPAVQTTQTATTDPTGTEAASLTVGNVPDGAMSTAAPGATVDPLTSAPVAQAADVTPSLAPGATTSDTTPAPATDPAEPVAPAEPASPAPAVGSEDDAEDETPRRV